MTNQLKTKKIKIPNVNTIFSELNKGNIPQELNFFMGGDELLDETPTIVHLNVSNRAFLNYLSSPSGQNLLQRNKKKFISKVMIFSLMIIIAKKAFIIFCQHKKTIQSLAWKLNILT